MFEDDYVDDEFIEDGKIQSIFPFPDTLILENEDQKDRSEERPDQSKNQSNPHRLPTINSKKTLEENAYLASSLNSKQRGSIAGNSQMK